jgi:hypothetical protein
MGSKTGMYDILELVIFVILKYWILGDDIFVIGYLGFA